MALPSESKGTVSVNLANKLTLVRIILIPIFLVLLLLKLPTGKPILPYQDLIATGIFILAAVTDGLDGYVARRKNQVTVLGKFMDPLADKLLVSAALIALVELGEVKAWIVWVILGREFLITGLRAIAATDGSVISASKLGKLKTVAQILAIIEILLHDWPFSYWGIQMGDGLLLLALILTVVSGIDYIRKHLYLLK